MEEDHEMDCGLLGCSAKNVSESSIECTLVDGGRFMCGAYEKQASVVKASCP